MRPRGHGALWLPVSNPSLLSFRQRLLKKQFPVFSWPFLSFHACRTINIKYINRDQPDWPERYFYPLLSSIISSRDPLFGKSPRHTLRIFPVACDILSLFLVQGAFPLLMNRCGIRTRFPTGI